MPHVEDEPVELCIWNGCLANDSDYLDREDCEEDAEFLNREVSLARVS